MSGSDMRVTQPGAPRPAPSDSVPFRFAGAVLRPGESVDMLQRRTNQADFRRQALLSAGIAIGAGLIFVLFGFAEGTSRLISDLYRIELSTAQVFLLCAYFAWCFSWGMREIVYLSESDWEPDEGAVALTSLVHTLMHISAAVAGVVMAVLYVPLVCGGSVALFAWRFYRTFGDRRRARFSRANRDQLVRIASI
jgi:hypothetical protein